MLPLLRLYRDAFGGLPQRTWLLCTAAFLNRCGSMVVPLLGPYLKRDFAFTPDQAGWVIGLYGIGAMIGSWLGGRLTDRIGPVRLQVLALGSSALWMLLMTQFHSAFAVVAAVFVLGIVNDAFRPGSNTAAALSAPLPLRRKALSLNRFALNLGWAFGPTIGGYLVVKDFTWMFVVDGATCGLAALWLAVRLRGWNPLPPPKSEDEPQHHGRPLRDPHFRALMVANLCVLLAFMQYFTTGPRVFVDQGYSEAHVGWQVPTVPPRRWLPLTGRARHRDESGRDRKGQGPGRDTDLSSPNPGLHQRVCEGRTVCERTRRMAERPLQRTGPEGGRRESHSTRDPHVPRDSWREAMTDSGLKIV